MKHHVTRRWVLPVFSGIGIRRGIRIERSIASRWPMRRIWCAVECMRIRNRDWIWVLWSRSRLGLLSGHPGRTKEKQFLRRTAAAGGAMSDGNMMSISGVMVKQSEERLERKCSLRLKPRVSDLVAAQTCLRSALAQKRPSLVLKKRSRYALHTKEYDEIAKR